MPAVRSARLRAFVASAAVVTAVGTAASCSPATVTPQFIAKNKLYSYGWGSGEQFSCLDNLWTRESNWRVDAANNSSGAYGIPQSLPGSKMSSAGPGWRTDASTQIEWGLSYIRARYGSPCSAWSHSLSAGWY